MTEHPSIRSRTGNVVFVGFGGRASRRARASRPQGRTCCSCAHWCGGEGENGYCLTDCGARCTPPQGRCGEWRRPPLLTVV